MSNLVVPANEVSFADLCSVLDQIAKRNKKSDKEKCFNSFINDFKLKAANIIGEKNTSFFPILRLLVPSIDRERGAYNMKESKLGGYLCKVLCIKKDSNDGRKLVAFRSVNAKQEGDFASVAYFVLKNRVSSTTSKMTVGDINETLDKIAFMEAGNKAQMLEDIFSHVLKRLSAEHVKWFLRLLLKDLRLGFGVTRILSCYHPDAPEHYNAYGKLIKVCEELEAGNVRPLEMGVQLFDAISPMLSERLDVVAVSQLPATNTYHIEDKFDGERFQVHMNDGVFKYFSRKGHCFTSTYGETYDSGLLTPRWKECFSPHVTSFILDGEMMGWHKTKQCFGSKGMAFDVKKITERSKFQPCFCAFDVLYYNGRSLIGPKEKGGLPLKERLKLLDNLFTDVSGAIQRSKRHVVHNNSDILNALNKAIESQDEGIVVKDTESYYIPNKRNAGWHKIKPEYTEGATKDLDLVIIGADNAENKRQGRAKSFLVACADAVEGSAPHRWVCVGRVATGLTYEERERVCTHLQAHWQLASQRAPPPALCLNKIKPDYWILPQHSIVLQVKATELIRSTDFGTSHTLRFPRVERIRDDKPVSDILTLDQFNQLVGDQGAVVKLSTKRINEDQIEAVPKTRKKRAAAVVQVAEAFRKVDCSGVEVTSQALADRKICILSDDEDCSREDLARLVASHGGKPVTNPGVDTWCCVVGRPTYRARVAMQTGEADVASTAWLRSLPPSPARCRLTPLELLSMTRRTRLALAADYDVFGDSYTEEIDEDTLRSCLKKMDSEPRIHLTNHEMLNLDKELFSDGNPHSFLRAAAVHTRSSILALQARMFGATICDVLNHDKITHIVLQRGAEVSVEIEESVKNAAKVVSEEWLQKCFLEWRMVEESDFLLEI